MFFIELLFSKQLISLSLLSGSYQNMSCSLKLLNILHPWKSADNCENYWQLYLLFMILLVKTATV